MEKTLDISRIKTYNAELQHYKDKSADTRAKLDINRQELQRLCTYLSAELGVTVTPDNIEAVYNQCVDKIESNLVAGEEILKRIKAEEATANSTYQAVPSMQQAVPSIPQAVSGMEMGGVEPPANSTMTSFLSAMNNNINI